MKTATLFAIPMLTLAGIALTGCDGQKETSTIVVSKAQERALRMGILANMPKDCVAVLSVFDVPNIVSSFNSLDLVKELKNSLSADEALELIPIPGEATETEPADEMTAVPDEPVETYVKDVAVGFGSAVSNWFATKYLKYIELDTESNLSSLETLLELAVRGNSDGANLLDKQDPMAQFLNICTMHLNHIDLSPAEGGSAPINVVATLTPAGISKVQEFLTKIQSKAPDHTKVSAVNYDGLPCVQMEVDLTGLNEEAMIKLKQIATQDKYKQKVDELIQLMQEKSKTGKLFIVFSLVEDTLRAYVTTNPEMQVKRVNSVEDSILAKDDFDFADNYLEHKNYALAYCSKDLVKSMLVGSQYQTKLLTSKGAELIKKVAPSWKLANAEATAQALSDIYSIYTPYFDAVLKSPQAMSFYAWQDNGINFEWESTKDAATELTSNTMANIRPTESTIFYSTSKFKPSAYQDAYKVVGNVSKVVWDFFYTYATKHPNNTLPKEVKMSLMAAPMALPVVSSCWNGLGDCVESSSGATTIMFDLNGKPAPELGNIPGPRLVVATELQNRAKLSEGWNKIYQALTPMAMMTGQAVQEPKVELVNDVSVYDYEVPLSKELAPVVAVSDKRWALGLPREFVLEQIDASNNPKPEVNNMEMLVNIKPLLQFLQLSAKETQDDGDIQMLEQIETLAKDLDSVRFTGKPASESTNAYRLQLRASQK